MLAIINNVAPHACELSNESSTKILQLFATMSSPAFLLANETNYHLLQALMEAINAIVEHQYESTSLLVVCKIKADGFRKCYIHLCNYTGSEEVSCSTGICN